MASGTLGDSSDDVNWRGGIRWTENSIVYRRRTQKKAKKTCNNNDTATPTASSAEKPISAAAVTSTNQIPTVTEVESATVSTTSPAVVPAASTSENPTNHAAASPPSPVSLATTTSPHGTAGDHDVQGPLEGTRDVDSFEKVPEHSPHQEQSLSHGSHDNNAGSSPQPLQAQLEHRHTSSDGEKDLPNGRKISTAQLPIGNEEHDEGLMSGSPQVPQDNGSVNVNGVVKPIGNETHNDGEASQGNTLVNANGVVKPLVISSFNDRIRFNLCKATPKNEIMELRNNLESELDHVRKVVRQLESKELQLASYNSQIGNTNLSNSSNYVGAEGANISGYNYPQPQHVRSNVVDRRLLVRVNSEIGAMGHQETRPIGLSRVNSDMGAARNLEPRVYNRQLSVAVMENNNRPNEYVEKEKRTPKANQYYRNSEFLLGKDRLPPESNKRSKTSNGRKHGETDHSMGYGFGFDKSRNQVFKNCSSLLQRLMKHKFGWVFNEPVNAKALGLVDYHDIIKHPMDLGTIKTKMSQNQYQSPREFSDDVRLVFHNAMTYNPKGQDVHFMAEQLLQIFEERWAVIEAEYNPYRKYQLYQDGGLPTPASRKALPPSHFSAPVTPAAAASVPFYVPASQMTSSMSVDHKIHRPHVGRTPAPKKPKAKDPNKRDMTYDEKQRLSTNLQGLPPEKLDAIVQIIKKRSTALSQHDDEIEVDIDNVDAETLWELDRFVTNYKKSLSKNKRKAELALQARSLTNHNVTSTNSNPPAEVQIESGTAFEKRTALADGEKRAFNGSRSSSSSSSSSDSGSSSSDSDSDSSSGDGSDAGQSPKT